jgi:ribonucleoside-diphosphate reductase alpha chain
MTSSPTEETSATVNKSDRLFPKRTFSSDKETPAEQLQWNLRTVSITDDTGGTIFKQEGVEAPSSWSDMAVKIVASKYFYGEHGTPQRETSVRALVDRVCGTISDWGLQGGYFVDKVERDLFCDELTFLCLNQYVAFNSPVWFNVGLWQRYRVGGQTRGNWRFDTTEKKAVRCVNQFEYPQMSACFIVKVEDNMESIMHLATTEAMLFKYGSGTGTNLSSIRSSREKLSGGGHPSGPLSFLRIYDQVGNVVKSGGRTRRAAKMNVMDDWHGDIEEFIEAKQLEERKARALIDAGYDGSFNGEVYRNTIAFQNENLSVRVSNTFMRAALDNTEWWTKSVIGREPLQKKSASGLLDKIAEGTWQCGDPGLQFTDTIQKWHTCAGTEPIYSTNPCSEYVFLDNTACNLASINLMKFAEGHHFDTARFQAAVRLLITAQDILIDNASYPTPEIAENSHIFRTLGLGFANLGSLLMSIGVPYDSDEGRELAASIASLMTGESYCQSAKLAERLGPFQGLHNAACAGIRSPASPDNMASMMRVMDLHHKASCQLNSSWNTDNIWKKAIQLGEQFGYRNAQVTVIAPTGTIAFMMDCDTTGIEPDIALVKYKLLAGGGTLKIVNRIVPQSLRALGYDQDRVSKIIDHIDRLDTIEDVDSQKSGLAPNHLPVFDCAFRPQKGTRSIQYMAHLKMMAAVQPFVSGAISKTVNVPTDITPAEIRDTYVQAWKMGLKCVAIYRDGSKRSQPLNTGKTKSSGDSTTEVFSLRAEVDRLKNELALKQTEIEDKKQELLEVWGRIENEIGKPVRRRMAETRSATTHKFDIAGHKGYLTVGLFENGAPGELFITMSKEGSTIGGLMDCIGALTSMALQYGVPLETIIRKFSFTRFEPAGYTQNPDIRQATSIIDYVFRWIGHEFNLLGDETQKNVAHNGHGDHVSKPVLEAVANPVRTHSAMSEVIAHFQSDAPACPNCGQVTVRNGACYKCLNCGESLGCS